VDKKKFCDRVIKLITDKLIEEGYDFDYNSFGVDGFTPSMGTLLKMDQFISKLHIPNELGDMEYIINRGVIKNIREHRRKRFNKDNEENIRQSQ